MKCKNKIFVIVVFMLLLMSCVVQSKDSEVIKTKYEITEMHTSFEMQILEYIPSGPCGTRAFASVCLGRNIYGDTIRVLSLCNTDTSFTVGQIINVIPKEKPNFEVSTGEIITNSTGPTINITCKTIFGELVKK